MTNVRVIPEHSLANVGYGLLCLSIKRRKIILGTSLYVGEIWKRSFISTGFFCYEKTLFIPEEFEKLAFRFRVDGIHFENEEFRKRWRHHNHVISLTEFSWHTDPEWLEIAALLNSAGGGGGDFGRGILEGS